MDTIVIYNNRKLSIRNLFFVFLFLLLTSCPGDDGCDDMGSFQNVPNLISLLPEQEVYNIGEKVTLNLIIDSQNNYFGEQVDFFELTNDESAKLTLGFNQLFIDNSTNIIIGSQAESNNAFNMPFIEESQTFELKIEITFEKSGNYSFFSSDIIEVIGEGCSRFVLETNVDWNYVNGRIEFEVIE